MEISNINIASIMNAYYCTLINRYVIISEDQIDQNDLGRIIKLSFETGRLGHNRLQIFIDCYGNNCICFYNEEYLTKYHKKMPKSLMYIFHICKMNKSMNTGDYIWSSDVEKLFNQDSFLDNGETQRLKNKLLQTK